jgi:formiminotetrahydrofolate cyclodeaminase
VDIKKTSTDKFIEQLASKAPTPGGGGAAALVGAVGTALGQMVGSLTVGKKQYADVQTDIQNLNAQASAIQAELLELIAKDAEVFEPLAKAYSLPSQTKEQIAEKARIMEACLRLCSVVPLSIMQACAKAIDLHADYAAKGAAIAISDVGCGVAICKAALQSASLNVFINTKAMQDRSFAEQINQQANSLLSEYTTKADAIYADIAGRLR